VLYQDVLLAGLRDPEEASAYLGAAHEDGDETVLRLALRQVEKARGLAK
jgi:DNA-binding phage protein